MNGLQKLSILCLLLGAVLLAGPAFGFTTVSSERGVAAIVADDQGDAYLGIQDNTGTEDKITPNDQVEILRLYDNGVGVDSAADIEASVVEFAGGQDDGFSVSVEEGDNNDRYPVVVECAGSDGGTGTMVFDLEATGTATVDATWETNSEIDVNCGGGGGGGGPISTPGLNVDTVEPPDDGFVEFELNNTATSKFKIVSMSVTHSNSTEITNEMRIDGESISANPWKTDGTEVGINGGGVQIGSGTTATVEIDAFDTDMNGESFTVTFVDDRGGSETTETVTVDVPCNAGTTKCSGTDSDVVVNDGGTADEGINTDGDVSLGNDSKTNDELTAGGDVSIGDGGKTNGEVDVGGDVSTGNNYTANDGLSADGDVSLGNDSKTNDEVTAGGSISAGNDYTASGALNATEDITVGSNSEIQDSITAGGDIYIGSDTKVDGQLEAGGNVYVGDSVKFNSDVTVDGTIYYGCDVTFNGDLDADSEESTCE